jgi:hypothetical protein
LEVLIRASDGLAPNLKNRAYRRGHVSIFNIHA